MSTLRCALVEMAVKYATVMKKKKMKVAVAMSVGDCLWGYGMCVKEREKVKTLLRGIVVVLGSVCCC